MSLAGLAEINDAMSRHSRIALRDSFASAALSGIAAAAMNVDRATTLSPRWIASFCYDVAEAMLAEKDSRPCPRAK